MTVENRHPIKVFEFCAMLKEAFERSFTTSNMKASFKRAGRLPFDANKLLPIPYSISGNETGTIGTPEQLALEFEKKRNIIREQVLGQDAKIFSCFLTAPRVMEIMQQKFIEDKKKQLQKEKEEALKRLRAEQGFAGAETELIRLKRAQLFVRAELCNETVE